MYIYIYTVYIFSIYIYTVYIQYIYIFSIYIHCIYSVYIYTQCIYIYTYTYVYPCICLFVYSPSLSSVSQLWKEMDQETSGRAWNPVQAAVNFRTLKYLWYILTN